MHEDARAAGDAAVSHFSTDLEAYVLQCTDNGREEEDCEHVNTAVTEFKHVASFLDVHQSEFWRVTLNIFVFPQRSFTCAGAGFCAYSHEQNTL